MYQQLTPIPHEEGIIKKDGNYFNTPTMFAREHLYYVHFGAVYTCQAPYRVSRKSYPAFLLARVIQGNFYVVYRGRQFTACPGDIIFLDCKEPHTYWAEDPVTFQYIHFDGCATQAYFDMLTHQNDVCFSDHPQMYFLFNYILSDLRADSGNDHKYSFLIHNIISLLAMPDKHSMPDSVKQAMQYISDQYQNELNLEDIASHVALNPQYFSRLFKRHTGYSPHQYITYVRMKAAKQLLSESTQSVDSIAFACGFSSSSHFIRAFKLMNSVTPNMFRKFFDSSGFR